MKVIIGTPALRPPTWDFVRSIMGLRLPCDWTFVPAGGYGGVDSALNALCEHTLAQGADWLVIMADDATVHPRCVERLLSWKVPLVAALSFLRYAPILPAVYLTQDERGYFAPAVELVKTWLKGHPELIKVNRPTLLEPREDAALIKVRRFGTHVTLVAREVLEATGPPWFTRQNDDGSGEDFHFVAKAEQAGFQPHVDLSQVTGHLWSNWSITALEFMIWSEHVDWDSGEIIVEVTDGWQRSCT